MVQKLGKTKKVLKVEKINAKDNILTCQEKQVSHTVNKTKRGPEITPRQREVEAQHLKASKMCIMKLIEKDKKGLSDIGVKIC